MGIAVGGGKRGPVLDPNIVPLIDVLLVLIIIFMVITPSVPTGLPAFVPTPQWKPEPVGLYWKAGDNAPESPLGPLATQASAEGYGGNSQKEPQRSTDISIGC
jgi:hypothetical protein